MSFRLRPPKIKLKENDVEKQCLDLLRLRGFNPIRLNVGKFKTHDNRWVSIGEPGTPDYVIPAFFMEVKRPGGELSQDQIQKIWELDKIWGLQTIVTDNVAELIEWLDQRVKP